MRCKICNKPIEENTAGDERYCQGHSSFKEKDSYKVRLLENYGCFEKGEEIIVKEDSMYFYRHNFWRIPKRICEIVE